MSTAAGELGRGRLRALLARLVLPADDWAQTGKRRRISPLHILLLLVAGMLCVPAATILLWPQELARFSELRWALLLLPVPGGIIIGIVMYQVQRHLLNPLVHLRTWCERMCHGDLSARIPVGEPGEFGRLAHHINRLSDALEKLATEMDDLVCSQTERLQEKNRSLETLYDIAATINASRDLEDLLERTAEKLMVVVDAGAATIRLRTEEGHMRLLRTIGFEGSGSGAELQSRTEGNVFSEIQWLSEKRPVSEEPPEAAAVGNTEFVHTHKGIISVPLRYQSRTLGIYSLFTSTPEVAENPEIHRLLVSVGKHLGMAVEKARLDKQEQLLSIMRERTSLAHELHDSLVQTLVSLRFQVKMLWETLESSGSSGGARGELDRITNSLDQAHRELRELLTNFRGPIDERGLLPALEALISRFRRDSGIATYFQSECRELHLSAASELQVLRIVSEALANVRKHSQAETTRILLRRDKQGNHKVLIEDDGVGIEAPVLAEQAADGHMGLSFMRERAQRLGGELRIESEPGEGTQVLLTFKLDSAQSEHAPC